MDASALFREAVNATAEHSAIQFAWFGIPSADVQEHVRPIFGIRPDAARGHLGGTLTNRLYEDFYQAGKARPSRAPYAGSTRANGLPEFVDELSAANAGSGTRQAGWLVVEHRDAAEQGSGDEASDRVEMTGEATVELAIRREGLTLRAKPEEIVYGGSGLPGVGDAVELKLPKELPAISPGFYTVLSDEVYDATDRQVVRVYWNLYPWGAAGLVRGITERLNGAGLPSG